MQKVTKDRGADDQISKFDAIHGSNCALLGKLLVISERGLLVCALCSLVLGPHIKYIKSLHAQEKCCHTIISHGDATMATIERVGWLVVASLPWAFHM